MSSHLGLAEHRAFESDSLSPDKILTEASSGHPDCNTTRSRNTAFDAVSSRVEGVCTRVLCVGSNALVAGQSRRVPSSSSSAAETAATAAAIYLLTSFLASACRYSRHRSVDDSLVVTDESQRNSTFTRATLCVSA